MDLEERMKKDRDRAVKRYKERFMTYTEYEKMIARWLVFWYLLKSSKPLEQIAIYLN